MPIEQWTSISLISMLVTLVTGFYVAHHWPPRPLAVSVCASIFSAFLFAVGDAGARIWADTPPIAWASNVCLYLGLSGVVYFWWLLTLGIARFQGQYPDIPERLLRQAPLAVVISLIGLIVTNPWHGQFLSLNAVRNDWGPGWYGFAAFQYCLVLATIVLAARMALRARYASDRRQALMILVGSTFPVVGNLLFVLPETAPAFDPTQLGVALCAVLFVTAIYRGRIYAASAVSFEQVLDWDAEPHLLVDSDGRLMHANTSAHGIIGSRLQPGHDALDPLAGLLRDRSDQSAVQADALRRLHRRGTPLEAHYRLDGEPARWIRLELTPVGPANGQTGSIIRLHDETESIQLAAARREAGLLALLKDVFATTRDAICVAGSRGEIRIANPECLRILDVEAVDTGSPVDGLFARLDGFAVDRAPFAADLARSRRDPEATIRTGIEFTDGRHVELRSMPLRNEYAEITGRLWQFRDVTAQRLAEVASRDEQVFESLGFMATGVAHDFNNLLAVILGNAELAHMRLRSEPEHVEEILQQISDAAVRGADMTQQLLTYTGLGRNQQELIDLSAVAGEAVALLSMDRHIEVQTELAPALPTTQGDAAQLGQALMNLMLNAQDAVEGMQGVIHIESGQQSLTEADLARMRHAEDVPPGDYVYVAVGDNGSGMDSKTLSRIFDPFFTTRDTGRGLGLATTLGIVRNHNGALKVDSDIGQGARFTLFLPAVPQPDSVGRTPAAGSTWQAGGRVLLADDNANVRAVVSAYLDSLGLSVVQAGSGAEALRAWDEHDGNFVAAVLDLTMRDMSGQALMARLRERNRRLPVLLASGYSQEPIPDTELASITAFLAKPYRYDAFVRTLRLLIGGRSPPMPAGADGRTRAQA